MRKHFFIIVLAYLLLVGVRLAAAGYSDLTLPRIIYKGGNDNARPEGLRSLLSQVARRTSIEVNREPIALKLSDPNLFKYPFIYLGGDEAFEPFADSNLKTLRKYLSYGGFLFIDDNSAKPDSGFDHSVRRMVKRLFPQTPLRNIPRDHSVFRSFCSIQFRVGLLSNHIWKVFPLKDALYLYTLPMIRQEPGHGTSWVIGITMSWPEDIVNDNFRYDLVSILFYML